MIQGANHRLQNEGRGGRPRSAAFTLVELLVVIAILSIVTVASIPMLLPALNSRAVREAARIVNTQFAAAQAQALATGRSAGVWIEKQTGEPSAAMDMHMAEVPPPYSGASSGVMASVSAPVGGKAAFQILAAGTPATPDTAELGLSAGLLHGGDLVRFNYSGPWYQISTAAADNAFDATDRTLLIAASNSNTSGGLTGIVFGTNAGSPNLPLAAASVAFQILRKPVKAGVSPVSLPTGAVIDLAYSGMSTDIANPNFIFGPSGSAFLTDNRPVVITFNKSGALENLYRVDSTGNQQIFPINSPLYLLIGKREKLPPPTAYTTADPPTTQAEHYNFRDLENLWVAINPQIGLTSTAEVADLPPPTATLTPDQVADAQLATRLGMAPTAQQTLNNAVNISRQFAQSAQATGGR